MEIFCNSPKSYGGSIPCNSIIPYNFPAQIHMLSASPINNKLNIPIFFHSSPVPGTMHGI